MEEEKKQAERLRKAASPTKKKSTKKTPKPMVRLATKPTKAASSFARCSSYCYFPVCVYPGCAQRQLKHTPEQEEYKKAYKFLYELMRNASNDALKQRRDDIKKNAKILLPLAIPIVQDMNFLETSPRLNPKMLRDKLQCLARSIGAYNKSHRYVDGQIREIFSETHSETDLETHSETYSNDEADRHIIGCNFPFRNNKLGENKVGDNFAEDYKLGGINIFRPRGNKQCAEGRSLE